MVVLKAKGSNYLFGLVGLKGAQIVVEDCCCTTPLYLCCYFGYIGLRFEWWAHWLGPLVDAGGHRNASGGKSKVIEEEDCRGIKRRNERFAGGHLLCFTCIFSTETSGRLSVSVQLPTNTYDPSSSQLTFSPIKIIKLFKARRENEFILSVQFVGFGQGNLSFFSY